MGGIRYAVYIKSAAWRALSRRKRAKLGACEACGSLADLQAHHTGYGRLGRRGEWRDLVVLCGTCHKAVHAEARTMHEPLDLVTARYVRTHQRLQARLLRNGANDELRERQRMLRDARAQMSG